MTPETRQKAMRSPTPWKEAAMETYSFGDWVVYDPGYKDPEAGRVTEDKGGSVFVCYHAGCTAASTGKRHLRRATEAEIQAAPNGIGFHRFDPWCPIAEDCPGLGRCEALAKERER